MSKDASSRSIVPHDWIEHSIHFVRGHRAMISPDLAKLYRVEPRVLVQAVKRNLDRFPADFMFQLTAAEAADLKSQIVISSWGGARTPPYAFTEQGVAMLSTVLSSKRAVAVNIEIMRVFVRVRQLVAGHADLTRRLDALEKKYDSQFSDVFHAIRELMTPPDVPKKPQIGFQSEGKK